MEIDYKKTNLDKNVVKFTINDDCMVIGDSQNIAKLFDYFDIMNNEVSNSLQAQKDDILRLQQVKQLLNDVSIIENSSNFGSKLQQHNYIKTDDQLLSKILSNDIVYGNDPLARLIPDEVSALIISNATKQHIDNMPSPYAYKQRKIWFENLFNQVHFYKLYGTTIMFINAKSDCIDYKNLKTNFGRAKYAIDQAGGIKILFRYAKERRTLVNVASIFNVSTFHIAQYLTLYNCCSWKQWCKFAKGCANWNFAFEKIVNNNKGVFL